MRRPQPPPYGALIARKRLAPPKMSITEAARRAGISDTRWAQLENGYRIVRGTAIPENAPASTLAAMAEAVGVTADELESEGARPDAAAELRARATVPPEKPDPMDEFRYHVRRVNEIASEIERRQTGTEKAKA